MADELAGKIAVITGGVSGLGLATAELFIEQGAQVVIGDFDDSGGDVADRLGPACRFLKTDVAKYGVRVNCLLPGQIQTGMIRQAVSSEVDPEKLEHHEATVHEIMQSYQPLKRKGEPRDAANAAMFLASDRFAYITGVVLPVDDGISVGDATNNVARFEEARSLFPD
ncbi:MAG: SDR family oxidoreductase [Novosphingobium sp.]|nr:SDR family oxidoreductase [Novosphingobium sp.]